MASHKDRMAILVQKISKLTDSAITKLSSVCYSEGASTLNEKLGPTAYSEYVLMFVNTDYYPQVDGLLATPQTYTYDTMTSNGRKLFNLEMAEAYYTVYHLMLALKELDLSVVMTKIQSFGEGEIRPDDIQSVIDMRDEFKKEAMNCIRKSNIVASSGSGFGYAVV